MDVWNAISLCFAGGVAGCIAAYLFLRRRALRSTSTGKPWRKNVLALVLAGYGVVTVMFIVLMAATDMPPANVYGVVQGPLMTLIGGSLAIAKDLVNLDASQDKIDASPGTKDANSPATDK